MATEKDNALIDHLINGTQSGTIHWEPTAVRDQFTTSFKGKYSVLIDKAVGDDGIAYFWLSLRDTNEREMLRVFSGEVGRGKLQNMFQLAQRESLNVDKAIDEILTTERSGEKIRDEDIPF